VVGAAEPDATVVDTLTDRVALADVQLLGVGQDLDAWSAVLPSPHNFSDEPSGER